MTKSGVKNALTLDARKQMDLRAGDTIRVWQKIKEGEKTRLQAFEGLVIARKHGSTAGATFTVRRVASGVGVEKIFPLYSPMIDKIDILRRSKVRRAKLYYVREKASREIRKKMSQIRMGTPEVIVGEALGDEPKLEKGSTENTKK